MAKGTRYGGASHTPDELADPDPQPYVRIRRAEIGFVDRAEVPSSVGMDFSQSSEKENSQSDSENQSRRQPAQTTENLSNQQATETDSDAPMTGTDGPRKQARQSARKRTALRITDVDTEFEEFD